MYRFIHRYYIKEDLKLVSRHNIKYVINVLNYKLGFSRYCNFEYKRNRIQKDIFEGLMESFIQTGGVHKKHYLKT